MNHVYKKLLDCYDAIRKKTDFVPEIAVVLGSGLGSFADGIKTEVIIDYKDIAGFPTSTVQGHAGRFVFGYVEDVPVAVMQGRVHYYEGYSMTDVVLPVRLLCMMGAKKVILTNAAGGINRSFTPGTLMALTDHISSFVPSPLIGENTEELGTRFPDMSNVYDKDLTKILKDTAKALGIDLKEGVYIQFTGPAYETPAEIRAAEALGADAVGMSTACEAVAIRHMGVKVCAVSCISNLAAGISKKPLTHQEVKETADRVSEQFKSLIRGAVVNIAKI